MIFGDVFDNAPVINQSISLLVFGSWEEEMAARQREASAGGKPITPLRKEGEIFALWFTGRLIGTIPEYLTTLVIFDICQ